jgi:hypothetical protein
MQQHERIENLVGKALEINYNNIESIWNGAKITFRGIENFEGIRPTMQQVVEGLERAIEIEVNGDIRIIGMHFFDALSTY